MSYKVLWRFRSRPARVFSFTKKRINEIESTFTTHSDSRRIDLIAAHFKDQKERARRANKKPAALAASGFRFYKFL